MTRSRSPLSPFRPKPLFTQPPITVSPKHTYSPFVWDKEVKEGESGRLGLRTISSKPASLSEIERKRDRHEHNLRERDRRREESIIYELIRTCISKRDVRIYLPGVNKTPENLSYHQILLISSEIVKNERHEMAFFDYHKTAIQTLEAECLKRGIPLPENRPHIVSPMEKHRRYSKIVKEALRTDRCRMHQSIDGDGGDLPTPREVALEMDKRLRESDGLFTIEPKRRSSNSDSRLSKRRRLFSPTLPTPHLSPPKEILNNENDFHFADGELSHGGEDTAFDIPIRLRSPPVDIIRLSPRLSLHSLQSSTTQHWDLPLQDKLEDDDVDIITSNNAFNLSLSSPSAGVYLGIETEPLFRLLSSAEVEAPFMDNCDTYQ
ncbi:unnamed protein product [Hydatigera taeniaeformis]|uniref:BHLH domain-containing protein n=1 Tax=Hydatigena taeniaeformis TaxID=6205 RepID=A0A0R3X014_HYDTA|nr:unnamed protein product [Hydatigera taeniaeformis]